MLNDMGEELQEGALACSVLANDANDLALLNGEGDVAERPDIVRGSFGGTVVGLTYLEVRILFAEDVHGPPTVDVVGEGAGANATETVHLADGIKLYCGAHNLNKKLKQKQKLGRVQKHKTKNYKNLNNAYIFIH